MGLKLGTNLDLNNVVKSLGKKYKLVPHLDMTIGEGDFEWDFKYESKKHDDAWHPSGDCTPSLRELYLKARGEIVASPISGSLYKTFMVGHFWHQYLQWIVEKKLEFAPADSIERRGTRVWAEDTLTTPKPFHWATGSGDIAPCSIPGDGDYAIDFKTMNARDFNQNNIPERYVAKWECQGNIYLDFFGLEQIIFVGICKDSPHDMKEFLFERNQPLIDALYLKWKIVSECLDEGIEPPEGEDIPLPLIGPIGT